MDLYKFSFAVLTAANVGLGLIQYRTSTLHARSRANSSSSPRSPRSRSRSRLPSARQSSGTGSASSVSEYDEHRVGTGNPFFAGDEEKTMGLGTNANANANRLLSGGLSDQNTAWSFQKTFFAVYLLVVAADWLQGPYLYTLYKDEKELAERTVAFLFAAGFVSAAVSASFVGALADQHGRKKACLVFCALYSCSCFSMVSDSVLVLLVGRCLGGVSTTLMYSVFETWMVHEYHAKDMAATGLVLGKVFGMMTTMSSVVAILAGVIGEAVVNWTGTKKSPFMLAIACLGTAGVLIRNHWSENFGASDSSKDADAALLGGKGPATGAGTDIKNIVQDARIVSLGMISCLFEGSMYLFVFFWSAALKSAHSDSALRSDPSTPPPFGLVFATFMSAMMLGSQIFTITTSSANSGASSSANNGGTTSRSVAVSTHTQYLSITVLIAALSFLLVSLMSSHPRREEVTLWSFCLFEAMVGVYYPSMGYLKGQIVPDGMRAKVYGLLRLPLNVFVVSVLGLTQEGDRHRDGVFLSCGGLLIVAYVIAQKYLA